MYLIKIKGIVQGVGFRPFIYRECIKRNLNGYVKNTGDGVEVVIDDDIEIFTEILKGKIPPLARIESYEILEIENKDKFNGFKILESSESEGVSFVPADGFLCNDCLNELRDQENYRYNYFFITCTNCGPRFTILEKTPYDRVNTSMRDFEMCETCKKEYKNPLNRRYHAQTIACPNCGPKLEIYIKNPDGNFEKIYIKKRNEIEETAKLIKKGNIVAIKGIGGFHIACVCSESVVRKLRKFEKYRESKPFALMVRDIEMAKKFVVINKTEENLLKSKARPILVLKKKDKTELDAVSNLDTIGIMLPYTALHFLLYDYIDEPLIMTSSNKPGLPITTDLHQQFANVILNHNRKILNPLDDSVLKVINNIPLFIRRSRGYVPESIKIFEMANEKFNAEMLAAGAEMMNTFCLYKNRFAILSGYIGDTKNYEIYEYFKKNLEKFLNFTSIRPEILICDLHPSYNTSKYTEELSKNLNLELIRVQHHLAHVYSVAGENKLENFVGIACDGTGYGSDGKIWGGEIFDCGKEDKRIGSLEELVMIGCDSAVIEPQKMLLGILCKFLSEREINDVMKKFYPTTGINLLYKQYTNKFNCIETTSCGRILDAASALLGFCNKRTYDGEPAMKLEANSCNEGYELKPKIEYNSKEQRYILKTTPVFEFLLENIGKDKGKLAYTVQKYIAEGLFEIAKKFKTDNKEIVFSGGCAYNRIMTSFLTKNGVLVNQKVPAGDGGISFGQIYYAMRHKI
ncbi:MAG: carbamoyltransferase HypF [Candidatus Altiarchaeales archaeon A3]|nr:MAG: carbamoyltransferase HypF [Candidatus Altiarchaeales archaeon A3]